MRRLIRADLKRVFRKSGFFVLMILAIVIILVRPMSDTAAEQVEAERSFFAIVALLAACIPIYSAIFTDDIRSGTLIGVIGRGISRKKILLAKMIESAIVLVLFYAVIFGIAAFIHNAMEIGVTPRQDSLLALYCVFTVIKGLGFLAAAALVVFSTWNTAFGMIVLALGIPFFALILRVAQDRLHLPFYDLSFEGLLEASYAWFSAGRFGWQIIPAIAILWAVTAFAVYLFNRKEIEL